MSCLCKASLYAVLRCSAQANQKTTEQPEWPKQGSYMCEGSDWCSKGGEEERLESQSESRVDQGIRTRGIDRRGQGQQSAETDVKTVSSVSDVAQRAGKGLERPDQSHRGQQSIGGWGPPRVTRARQRPTGGSKGGWNGRQGERGSKRSRRRPNRRRGGTGRGRKVSARLLWKEKVECGSLQSNALKPRI